MQIKSTVIPIVKLVRLIYPPSNAIQITGQDFGLVGDAQAFASLAYHHELGDSTNAQAWPDASLQKPCCLTGNAGLEIKTDTVSFSLNLSCIKRLFLVSLRPDEARYFRGKTPDAWWIKPEFYSTNGMALKPKLNVMCQCN